MSKCEQMRANLLGLIARSVGKEEMQTHPETIKAMDDDWGCLS